MVSRRNLFVAAGLGAGLAGLAMPAIISPASAQTPGESTWQRIQRTKRLRIGAVATGAPYYQKNQQTGEWSGFYYNIAKQLASDLESELVIHETVWGNGVLDIQSGKIDILFGLAATPKRALAIDFTDPVFLSVVVALAKDGFAPRTWAELNSPNITIAVDTGSSHDQAVTRAAPKAKVLRFKSVEEATIAYQSGRADCQILAILLAMNAQKKMPNIGKIILPTPAFGGESAAGIAREQDKTFRDYLNYFIRYNRNNGFIREQILGSLSLLGLGPDDWPAAIPL
jgi:polar amino acid transport system substrate-binding protein